MDTIEVLENSEYNNAGELLGLDLELNGELSHALGKLNPVRRARVMKKLSKPAIGSRGSRAEMEKFFKELPEHIKTELAAGKLRLADTTVYSVKKVNSKTIKMFETQDDKEIAVSNISNAKLAKNFAFLVSGITLLAGTLPEGDDIDEDERIKAIDFKSINNYPAIVNGEHSLKANKKQIIPEGEANMKFVTDQNHLNTLGFYKLDNPRLITDDVLIEFTIELGSMAFIPEDTYLKVVFHGSGTTP